MELWFQIQALKTCVATLSGKNTKHAYAAGYGCHQGNLNSSKTSTNDSTPVNDKLPRTFVEPKSRDEETRLLMAQFCIDQLVLQIQSRGDYVLYLELHQIFVMGSCEDKVLMANAFVIMIQVKVLPNCRWPVSSRCWPGDPSTRPSASAFMDFYSSMLSRHMDPITNCWSHLTSTSGD